jgi:hypothetical protein
MTAHEIETASDRLELPEDVTALETAIAALDSEERAMVEAIRALEPIS